MFHVKHENESEGLHMLEKVVECMDAMGYIPVYCPHVYFAKYDETFHEVIQAEVGFCKVVFITADGNKIVVFDADGDMLGVAHTENPFVGIYRLGEIIQRYNDNAY